MGLLHDGKWVDQWYDTKASDGYFVRRSAQFRNWITPEGDAGPTGIGGCKAEAALTPLFDTLDWLEAILAKTCYLTGPLITEANWRLFTTLIRFDPVYVGHFKCNLRRIIDYPNLSNYLRDLYQQPRVEETVNMQHIKQHYYASHETINPSRVVPVGPDIDFTGSHDGG